MVTLCDLPNNILLPILTEHGCSEHDIYAFSKVNHRLHALAKRCLYRKNASQNRSRALLWASETGNLATALYALERGGADINTKTRGGHCWPLLLASTKGHGAMVQLLLSKGADSNATTIFSETALMVAALNGHEKIAKLLVETPTCNIEAENSNRRRALSYAVQGDCEAIVQLLIDRGTDVNHRDRWETALAIAARLGRATIARLLLHHGADLNLVDGTGRVPLHWAAANNSVSLVRLFLADPRIDVNAQEHWGRPALFLAVQMGQRTIVNDLLSHPMIDLKITDICGRTALMDATELGHLDIAALIEASCKEQENTNSTLRLKVDGGYEEECMEYV
ncbi:hypothetical protein CDV55_100412 [Aspergillus turcosus]|nr:hypothetical protein CDV55_100412 [Aspergillus turcosus]